MTQTAQPTGSLDPIDRGVEFVASFIAPRAVPVVQSFLASKGGLASDVALKHAERIVADVAQFVVDATDAMSDIIRAKRGE